MSNSVVMVTEPHANDSLVLVVGEDGTVTPDKETVETFLSNRSGPTELQVMRVNKLDGASVDVTVESLMYVHNEDLPSSSGRIVNQISSESTEDMEEIARNLLSFRMDHDYTPLTSPKRLNSPSQESGLPEVDDELANTLRILEGDEPIGLHSTDLSASTADTPQKPVKSPTKILPKRTPAKVKARMINTNQPVKITRQKQPQRTPVKPKVIAPVEPINLDDDEEEEEDEDFLDTVDDFEDDSNDSDFELEQAPKIKGKTRATRRRTKSSSEPIESTTPPLKSKGGRPPKTPVGKSPKTPPPKTPPPKTPPPKTPPPPKEPDPELAKTADRAPTPPAETLKTSDKKPPKKEKKTPKPMPDDFALFSTPDIIKRVGGKEPTTPLTPTTPDTPKLFAVKPAKITPENRSKSGSSLESRSKRTSLSSGSNLKSPSDRSSFDRTDRASFEKSSSFEKALSDRSSLDRLSSERHSSTDRHSSDRFSSSFDKTSESTKERRLSTSKKLEERRFSSDIKKLQHTLETSNNYTSSSSDASAMETLPTVEDINEIIGDNSKSFTTSLVLPDTSDLGVDQNVDQNNMNLETGGLDLDQSLLDNINSDLISEDILYQVAKSLVDNTELQNVIDKSISDGNLLLDPSMQQALNENVLGTPTIQQQHLPTEKSSAENSPTVKQVVRGGRVINIPPIERPATRSRNKKPVEVEKPAAKVIKPLDDDHVFGSEMESSEDDDDDDDDDEDKDEDEDDPNKLWCICNTPHNNRFMICCDICEEWYHGKCVNVTKAMGQMMEQEGKEWICLYCKDKSLTRPSAAARRIRKASRTSTDSAGSSKRSSISAPPEATSTSDLQCIVCGNPSRNSSIYCSDVCIQKHAQGFKRSVVINRKTGKCLSGTDAPSEAELKQWLERNPGWEVLKTTRKTLNMKPTLMQSKLKVIKNVNNEGVSLAIQKKGVSIGVLQHSPKQHERVLPAGTPTRKPIEAKNTPVKHPTPQPHLKQTKLIHVQVKQAEVQKTTPPKPKPALVTTPKLTTPVKLTPKEIKPAVPKPRPRVDTPAKEQPREENIRDNVKKTLFEQLTNRVKLSQGFELGEEDIQSISVEIESQLYKCFGDTGQKYRNKYRSLMFNIKDIKNETLWRRICDKSVSPYQLVRLSPDDLASQELASWREREAKHTLDMIKKTELESLNYNRQMVFKTHKGEQILEDDRLLEKVDNSEVIATLGPDGTAEGEGKDKDKDKKGSGSKHSRGDKSKDRGRSKDRARSHERNKDRKASVEKSVTKDHKKDRTSSSKDRERRKRSRSRDRSRHTENRKRSRSRERDRHRERRSSHKSSRHKKETHSTTDKLDNRSKEILDKLVDNRILPPLEDRLWKHVPQDDMLQTSIAESDSDHEPSSTVTIPTPPRSIDPDEVTPQTSAEVEKPEKRDRDPEKKPPQPSSSSSSGSVKETEDGSSSPPPPQKSSPSSKEDSESVWKGSINMVDVAETSIVAQEVSGDCSALFDDLPDKLEVVGRIAPEIVWEYIGKMKSSNSKMISLIRLNAKNIEEKMPYLALYTYLSSRNRLGVIKSTHKAIKDFYIYPLGFRQPIPQALLPINGPGFEESRPPLLLGIIVRDKRKRPLLDPLPSVSSKRAKVEIPSPSTSTVTAPAQPPRSYTPPPSRDPRLKLPAAPPPLPIPPLTAPLPAPLPPSLPPAPLPPEPENDEDVPYSPEDSDPDSTLPAPSTPPKPSGSFIESSVTPQAFEPFANKFDTIPGLDASSSQEIQGKIRELDEGINQCQAEINSIINNKLIANSNIGQSALASISIPSNLQQILENIKHISKTEANTSQEYTPAPITVPPKGSTSTDLTIPLMLPKISSRSSNQKQDSSSSSPTIPLNLPKNKTSKPSSLNSPLLSYTSGSESDKSGSVLSSLTEEDLIRKAAEMLGESNTAPLTPTSTPKTTPPVRETTPYRPSFPVPPPPVAGQVFNTPPPPIIPPVSFPTPPKRSKVDLNLPPVPGLEDET